MYFHTAATEDTSARAGADHPAGLSAGQGPSVLRNVVLHMNDRWRNVLGIGLIVAGVIAMPIPVIPGIPMIIAGAAILGVDHPVTRYFQKQLAKWKSSR